MIGSKRNSGDYNFAPNQWHHLEHHLREAGIHGHLSYAARRIKYITVIPSVGWKPANTTVIIPRALGAKGHVWWSVPCVCCSRLACFEHHWACYTMPGGEAPTRLISTLRLYLEEDCPYRNLKQPYCSGKQMNGPKPPLPHFFAHDNLFPWPTLFPHTSHAF